MGSWNKIIKTKQEESSQDNTIKIAETDGNEQDENDKIGLDDNDTEMVSLG